MSSAAPEQVSFLTVEDGDDLIVGFAIHRDERSIASLILLRTPKYEHFLPPEERGVTASHESYPETEDDRLLRATFSEGRAELVATSRRYDLDVSRVDEAELRAARTVLQRMNFDSAFQLRLGDLGT